jgi:hypothetical protein
MEWIYSSVFGGGGLIAILWVLAPTWRALLRGYPADERDSAAVFRAQHSSSHG